MTTSQVAERNNGVQPPPGGRIDIAAAERAAQAFLVALGASLDSPHGADTPRRMAAAFAELLSPPSFVPTVFDSSGYDGLVVVGGIRFTSLCAHHGLPFVGTADVGYQPAGQILGLSKLAWAVQLHAHRLQVQEQFTTQVADWVLEAVGAKAVGVRVQAQHLCMSLRGVRAVGAMTITSAIRGALADDALLRQEWAAHLSAVVAARDL